MSNPDFFARVVADSISPEGIRLTTIHARYPRIIHGEVMTHRLFSRNARSSRAVPVKTMLDEVRNTPFVPWHWGKNQKGMQAGEEVPEILDYILPSGKTICQEPREAWWLRARNDACAYADRYMRAGVHKQIANRLLEPFSWIDTLITSTSWANFDTLRIHADAEPHMRDLAVLIKEARDASTPELLQPGEWHLPYVEEDEGFGEELSLDVLKKLSVARCARISYKPFDGDASIEKELERYDMLVGSQPLHASPAEHQATPDTKSTYRKQVKVFEGVDHDMWNGVSQGNDWNHPELHGNLTGWCQLRKSLTNEFVPGWSAPPQEHCK